LQNLFVGLFGLRGPYTRVTCCLRLTNVQHSKNSFSWDKTIRVIDMAKTTKLIYNIIWEHYLWSIVSIFFFDFFDFTHTKSSCYFKIHYFRVFQTWITFWVGSSDIEKKWKLQFTAKIVCGLLGSVLSRAKQVLLILLIFFRRRQHNIMRV